MIKFLPLLQSVELAAPLSEVQAQYVAAELKDLSGLQVYPRSITAIRKSLFFLGLQDGEKTLGILATNSGVIEQFEGEPKPVTVNATELVLKLAPTTAANAAALRSLLPFLKPQLLGLRKSAGCGDRLGLPRPVTCKPFNSIRWPQFWPSKVCGRTPVPGGRRRKLSMTLCGAFYRKAGATATVPTPIT